MRRFAGSIFVWATAILLLAPTARSVRANPADPKVTVEITSSPPGATLRINGLPKGETPWKGLLAPGPATVALSATNYKTLEKRVVISPPSGGAPQKLAFSLLPAFGRLTVEGPKGAEVWVDGVKKGQLPWSSDPLGAGTHLVEVRRLGHKPMRQSIDLGEGQRRALEFDPKARTATVHIVTRTADGTEVAAALTLDGLQVGRTPMVLRDILPGLHRLVVQDVAGHYEPMDLRLQLAPGSVTKREIKLAASTAAPKGYVRILPGDFMMGSPAAESGRDPDEGPRHAVRITREFLLKEREVTQSEWRALMGTEPWRFRSCGPQCPVESVSWWDALAYCNARSRSEGLRECYVLQGCNDKPPGAGLECRAVRFSGLDCPGYRLPTEAEWEFAARAGTDTAAYSGHLVIQGERDAPILEPIAWYSGNSDVSYAGGRDCRRWEGRPKRGITCGAHPVGTKQPNAFGLYDMLGNVWEWVWDYHGTYVPSTLVADPTGLTTGSTRVYRGGSWATQAWTVRAACRFNNAPTYRDDSLGFRPARSVP